MIFDLWTAGVIALVLSFYGMFIKWVQNNRDRHDRRERAREEIAEQFENYLDVHDADVKRIADTEEFRRDFE